MSNANNRVTTYTTRQVMSCAAFVAGFKDYNKGKPIDEKWNEHRTIKQPVNHAWRYERGRQFAVLFKQPLKHGRHVRGEAIAAFNAATGDGSII